jgi:hypothetical protein
MGEETESPGFFQDRNARWAERQKYPMTISIDPGSSEYAIRASYEDVVRSFRRHFPAARFEREHNFHSPDAGTSIHVILTALSVGLGVAGAEMGKEVAKGIGKDLWEAVKGCLKKRSLFSRKIDGGADSIKITVLRDRTEISITLPEIGPGNAATIRHFIDEAIPDLVAIRRELDALAGNLTKPKMRVPQGVEEVEFEYRDGGIILARPLCLSCEYLDTPFLGGPCKTCGSYYEKPGQHAGRPGASSFDADGNETVYDDFHNPIPVMDLVEWSQRTYNFRPRSE